MTAAERTGIVVVGAGGVGIGAALFLSRAGVPPVVLERNEGTSEYPRATGLAPRTRELLRELGLDDAVLRAGSLMARNGGKVMVERLATTKLGSARRNSPVGGHGTDIVASVSPITSSNGICPQDVLEPVLLDAARQDGADVRFGIEVVRLEPDDDGVTVVAVDQDSGGQESRIRADYVVAADGAGSRLRGQLGIGVTGPGALGGPMISVLFVADLADLVRGHEFVVCEVRNADVEGLLLAINNTNRWVFYISCPPESGRTPADFPVERCRELVRAAIGLPELPIDIVAVMPWQPTAYVADRMRSGRVFLAGDAAHVMPPSGAYGLNTGLADAHNLAWKLAMVLRGEAGPALLDSYQQERLPVAQFTADQAMLVQQNPRLHWNLAAGLAEREKLGMAHPVVVSLAYQYKSDAVVGGRGVVPALSDPAAGLDGHPGSRAPHLWVRRNGSTVSTLDVLGAGLVVFAGPDGASWVRAADEVADRLGVVLEGYRIGPDGELVDEERRWSTLAGVKPDGALLVRPDGFVAWRAVECAGSPIEAAKALERAARTVLAR